MMMEVPASEAAAPDEEGDLARKRTFRRRSVLWPAKLRCGKHEFAAQVWNVSLGGAKLRIDIPLKEGTDISILIPAKGVEIPAEIVWQSGELLGIYFSIDSDRIKAMFDHSAFIMGLEDIDEGI